MNINKEKVFTYQDQPINRYTMKNNSGMSIEVIDVGCSITKICFPNKDGELTDLVLGYQELETYLTNPLFFGAVVGRFANRINKGEFNWQGKEVQLETNDGVNHLHGGSDGFSHRIWENIPNKNKLLFKLNSPDGDANFPGEITAYVSYQLTSQNELIINYKITTPDISFANLTNHSYFNLSGDGSETITDHYMKINADSITEVDQTLIPTGKLMLVNNTPMDFREYKQIKEDIDADFDQLIFAGGFDHNYVLNNDDNVPQASVYSPKSGIKMQVYTNCPGVQFYAGNAIIENTLGKTGKAYKKRSGFCLETQFFPDAPNQPSFAQPIVKQDQALELQTIYKFSLKE